MKQILQVYLHSIKAGTLWLEAGYYHFQYDKYYIASHKIPLSISMPLNDTVFPDEITRAFFANLLPESHVRILLARQLHISETNDFGLLKAIGGECAGAISLLEENEKPNHVGKYEKLTAQQLKETLKQIPKRPFLNNHEDLRLSLAGANDKLPIYYDENDFYLPTGNKPSSHIIKISIPEFDDTITNEHFCLQLASSLFPVCESQIITTPEKFLLIKRYDRIINNDIIRIHQEDVCQSLSIMPDQKYQNEGGPTLKDCADLIWKYSSEPIADIENLMSWTFFNYLIGNADAHAKNISFLIQANGIKLAPFYDLMSTTIYKDLSKKLAMKIGGQYKIDFIQKRHWDKFFEEINVDPSLALNHLQSFSAKVSIKAETLVKQIDAPVTRIILAGIKSRMKNLI